MILLWNNEEDAIFARKVTPRKSTINIWRIYCLENACIVTLKLSFLKKCVVDFCSFYLFLKDIIPIKLKIYYDSLVFILSRFPLRGPFPRSGYSWIHELPLFSSYPLQRWGHFAFPPTVGKSVGDASSSSCWWASELLTIWQASLLKRGPWKRLLYCCFCLHFINHKQVWTFFSCV